MRKRDFERSKNYRYQQYRSAWEKESWAQGWLSRSHLDPNKAFCNVCLKELVPGKSELQCHSKSAVHTRRIKAEQRIFACKTECPSHDVMHNKGKEGYVVISNMHPHQELYRFKPELSSEFASQAQHNGSEGIEVSGSVDSQVNDILAETQAVSDIGFTEDMWDNSLQVDTATAVEGVASLSRNDTQMHSNQSSSTQQQTQIVIITPSSTASSSDDIFPSTALARSQSFIVTRSEAVSRNRKPVSSSTRLDNFTNTSSSSSYKPNYSCISSQPQTSPTSSLELKTSGKCNDCCSKCKIHDSHWREYLTEKIKFKRLEQQRVREELKTQRLIQQYHQLKLKRLLREDNPSNIE